MSDHIYTEEFKTIVHGDKYDEVEKVYEAQKRCLVKLIEAAMVQASHMERVARRQAEEFSPSAFERYIDNYWTELRDDEEEYKTVVNNHRKEWETWSSNAEDLLKIDKLLFGIIEWRRTYELEFDLECEHGTSLCIC